MLSVCHGLTSRAKFVNSFKNQSRTFRQHVKYNPKRVKDFKGVQYKILVEYLLDSAK